MEKLLERVWSYQYKRSLPDSAYSFIKPGGEKDSEGRTQQAFRYFPHHTQDGKVDPVHLRNANSRCPQSDLTDSQKAEAKAHLDKHKKALGIGEFAEAKREPFKHAWKEQEEIEFEVAPEPTMDELIESIEDIVESINVALDEIRAQIKALKPEQPLEPKQKPVEEGKVVELPELVELRKAKVDVEAKLAEAEKKLKKWGEFKESVKRRLKEIVFERVPQHWGYGPLQQNRRLKEFIRELEGS